ncbi:MAG: phosphatidyl-myo-inositol alpha-mannosyltransferase [Frankiaceae bacterium]|nr:phosphatidyl-myo-inositol alpha-mannosyltransferase [Frankiaceae bacterium]
MKVGLVSPYPWDVPGGVVAHVRELAETLISLGHDVSVISPVDDEDAPLPPWVTRAGRSVPVPFNGSVSRLIFGPVSASRVRRWLHDGDFDVLHLHSPETLSLSLLALMNARGPIVATFHAANPRSRVLALLQSPLQVQIEKIVGSIAVSPAARKTIVEHLGSDAVVIPNGVHVRRYADAAPLPGWPGSGGALGFVGRIDEPRKGLSVLLEAMPYLWKQFPDLRLLVAGPGELDHDVDERVVLLGQLDEDAKAQAYRSVDVFVAPNTGGESFGIILLEAMAAGTPIVASDLDAFRRVLDAPDGDRAGALATVGDAESVAHACASLLSSPARLEALSRCGRSLVSRYDWTVVAAEIVRVYETAVAASVGRVVEELEPM